MCRSKMIQLAQKRARQARKERTKIVDPGNGASNYVTRNFLGTSAGFEKNFVIGFLNAVDYFQVEDKKA